MKKLFPGLFKYKEPRVTENLPDLIRKMNKTDLAKFDSRFDTLQEKTFDDPLLMRINVEKINYIQASKDEKTLIQRLRESFKYYFAKANNKHRYDFSLNRPNEELRKPYYGYFDDKFNKISNLTLFLFLSGLAYVIGYTYARFRNDVYVRRFMYVKYTSVMLVFEFVDYHVSKILDTIEYYFPRDFSQLEYEFVVYKKIRNYFRKKRLGKDVDLIINTDPDVVEIDNIMRKIR
jgi:hypothetical protein